MTVKKHPAKLQPRRRVLVVDDHPMMRYGMGQMVDQEPDLMVCGEAENVDQALSMVKSNKPNLVLIDLTMPGKSGLEFLKDIKTQFPAVPVLVVSMHDETLYAERVLRAGAQGYIMKSEGGARLLKAIRQVLQGRPYVSERLSARILDVFAGHRSQVGDPALSALTDREFEIFQHMSRGLSTKEVGQLLHLSPKTVETHRQHIKEKLKCTTGSELTQYAVRWGASQGLL